MDCPACGAFNSVLDTECACGRVLRETDGKTSGAPKKIRRRKDEALRSQWLESTVQYLERHSIEEAERQLRKEGLRAGTAKRVMVEALRTYQARKARRTGMIWLGIGLGVTLLTFAVAEPGGSYIVAFGPVLYGLSKLASAR